MSTIHPPRHLVWSTESVDLDDPFQRQWYVRQVLIHGRAEDVGALDLDEVARLLDGLNLPGHIYSLWDAFLKRRGYDRGD